MRRKEKKAMPLRDIIQLANLINKVRQKIYIHWNAIAQTYKSANRKIHGPAKNRTRRTG